MSKEKQTKTHKNTSFESNSERKDTHAQNLQICENVHEKGKKNKIFVKHAEVFHGRVFETKEKRRRDSLKIKKIR